MLILLCLFVCNQAFATIHIIEATELEFTPTDITIELGDTVRFVWIESNHAIASGADGTNDEVFMAFPLNDADPERDLILDAPGYYPYFCAFHLDEEQLGSITVLSPEVIDCGELFFSEYIEGSSNNKALEIYNPTEQDIDLSNYSIKRYNNGGTDTSADVPLEGVVKAGDVFLIVHGEAADGLINQSDLISSNIVNFNGNDALELYNGGLLIDLFGRVGENPGDGWLINEMDSVLTEEVTLVRKSDVNTGALDWEVGITQWDDYEQNDFSFVGMHANNTCNVIEFTGSIGFENANISFNETDADYSFNIVGLDIELCYDFKVAITGTATQDEDYTILEYSGDTLELSVCPESPSIIFTIDFIEDELSEISENIVFEVIDLPTGVVSGNNEFVVTINDENLPTGTIGDIAAIDSDGIAINVDKTYQVKGIVYGPNFSENGLLFVIRDETGGIAVFSGGDDFGYEVNEGDEVLVSGVVTQFRGLIEIVPFEIELLSSGNSIKEPTTVTSLDENSELDLVKLECVQLVDPSEWTNGGPGFNVNITDGQNTYTMRIYNQVDLYGMEAPTGSFDVVGLGWQFASSNDAPFADGYQINPRSQNDIIAKDVVANFSGTNEGLTYTFVATEGGADSYSWNFGDGSSGNGSTVEHTFTGNGTYNVILTVNKDGCTASSNQTYVIDNTGISELLAKVSIFPNPTRNVVNISGDFYFDSYKIYDITGKTFLENKFPETNTTQIDFTALTSGMYFLQITGEAGTIIEKIKLF